MKNKKPLLILLTAILILILDRLLKSLALKNYIFPADIFFIIPKIFSFTLFKNKLLAFSLPFNNPLLISALSLLTSLILFYCGLKFYKQGKLMKAEGVFLIILGAGSNLFDRLAYGFVIDYFHLWPISFFNLADCLISGGIIWLIAQQLKNKRFSP